MVNVFEAVRVNGKLVARDVKSGVIAGKGLIRDVQLRSAEANGEVLVVSATGRVSRMPKAQTTSAPATPAKMSFLSVLDTRNPEVM